MNKIDEIKAEIKELISWKGLVGGDVAFVDMRIKALEEKLHELNE